MRAAARVWLVSVVRNEADIVELTVRHHLAQGVERLLFIDNGSTDGTDEILHQLSRSCPLAWRRSPGRFHQAELLTSLAREAFAAGAEWVVAADADEFWIGAGASLQATLTAARADALCVEVVNFVQHRDRLTPGADALATMTRRTRAPLGSVDEIERLVATNRVAFVEHRYAPKWIARASADLTIGWGNHTVSGTGPARAVASDILCLHAPLRSRATLAAKLERGRRESDIREYLEQAWHIRRWRSMDADEALEAEWRANSYSGDALDVYGEPHPLIEDTRLRDLLMPWLHAGSAERLRGPSDPAHTDSPADSPPEGLAALVRTVPGWLTDQEAAALMRAVSVAMTSVPPPHALVEVGSFHGRSTVALAGMAARLSATAIVYAVDPHLGEVGAPDSPAGFRQGKSTLSSFLDTLARTGLAGRVVPLVQHSFEVAWSRPIGLLYIDGLHDRTSVAQDCGHFWNWVAVGGLVAFHDCIPLFPAVQAYVHALLTSGCAVEHERAGSLVVLRKAASGPLPPEARVQAHEVAASTPHAPDNLAQAWRAQAMERGASLERAHVKLAALEERAAEQIALVEALSARVASHDRVAGQLDAARLAVHTVRAQLLSAETAAIQLRRDIAALHAEVEHRGALLSEFRQSASWRATAPLRALVDLFRSARRRSRFRVPQAQAPAADAAAPALENRDAVPELPWYLRRHTERGNGGVLVISDMVPRPDQDAGSHRMLEILLILRGLGRPLTLLLESCEPGDDGYVDALRERGVTTICPADIRQHLTDRGHEYDAVLLSRPDVTFRYLFDALACAVHATVIYDTVDLHFVRFRREATLTGSDTCAREAARYEEVERINASGAHVTLVVSEADGEALQRLAPSALTRTISMIHRPESQGGPEWRARRDLLFVGGFRHRPNVDAVCYFVEQILPWLGTRLPGVVLHVVGSHTPDGIHRLSSPSLRCHGHVRDLTPFYQEARVFVAPLRFGAGVKGKITQSMAWRLPVVTTTVGAEGIGLVDGDTARIADTPEAFAAAVYDLYTDEAKWARISEAATRHATHAFAPERAEAVLRGMLDSKVREAR